MANNKKIIKGSTEKECASVLRLFMEEFTQNPTQIAKEIQAKQNVRFSPHTIGRWLKDEQTMTFDKWGQIEKHMKRYNKS